MDITWSNLGLKETNKYVSDKQSYNIIENYAIEHNLSPIEFVKKCGDTDFLKDMFVNLTVYSLSVKRRVLTNIRKVIKIVLNSIDEQIELNNVIKKFSSSLNQKEEQVKECVNFDLLEIESNNSSINNQGVREYYLDNLNKLHNYIIEIVQKKNPSINDNFITEKYIELYINFISLAQNL